MPITNGTAVPGSAPSGPSVLPPSLRSRKAFAEKMRQVNLADHLRLMADNQRVLNISAADNQANRQQANQFRQAQLDKAAAELGLPSQQPQPQPQPQSPSDPMATDDMATSILVDSPTTTNHNYPAPPAPVAPPPAGLSTIAKVGLGTVLALGGGGLGAGAVALMSRTPAAVTQPAVTQPTLDPGAIKITVTNPPAP